jgi:periplasmic mercuric ion binding protein
MSIVKQISLFALAAVLFTSCKDTSKDGNIETGTDSTVTDSTQVKETAANLEKTSFKIDGMTCAIGCAKTIQNKLAGLEGVEDAKVDFETKEATVSFDPAKQTPEKLVETVEDIADGAYKVSDVKSSGDKAFYHVDQEKEKEKKKNKKDSSTTKKEDSKKGGCCSADAKTEKKGGCCSADKKAGSM